jgi:hypothetical protein
LQEGVIEEFECSGKDESFFGEFKAYLKLFGEYLFTAVA